MKKQVFLLCLFALCLSLNTFGQVPLVKPGAVWHYGFHLEGEEQYGYVQLTYESDAFVNNQLHHRILEEEYTYQASTDEVIKTNENLLFVRTEVDSMFLSEEMIYNRFAQIGDTLGSIIDENRSLAFIITNVDTIDIQGFNHQQQMVAAICDSDTSYTLEILDQIGIVKGPHKHFKWIHGHACPGEQWDSDNQKIYNFRCYSDNDLSIMANADIACDAFGEILSSNNELTKESLKVMPNPNNGQFKISGLYQEVNHIIVYNLMGEIVFKSTIRNMEPLDLMHLRKGFYLLKINNKETRKITIR